MGCHTATTVVARKGKLLDGDPLYRRNFKFIMGKTFLHNKAR